MRGRSVRWLPAACAAAVLVGVSMVDAPSASASAPTCRIENLSTHRAFAGTGGHALRSALDRTSAPTRGMTLRITGVCVGNYTIHNKRVTLVGQPTRNAPTPTLQGAPGVWGSVLRITGNSHVIIKDLRITGGTGTLLRLLGPEPLVTAVGGGILQDGGTLTLLGHTLVDHNKARSDVQYWPGTEASVWAGAGGGLFAARALVQVRDDTRIVDNQSTSGEDHVGGGGGVYVDSGVVMLRDRARITSNGSSGAWVASAGTLRVSGRARIDTNYGGGDGDPQGGGVINLGALSLTDNASIDHNEAFWGGGVSNSGVLTMRGAARIADNNGWLGGGGVYNDGRIELGPGVAVTGNQTATDAIAHGGGGVLNYGADAVVVGDTSAVHGNFPDDIKSW